MGPAVLTVGSGLIFEAAEPLGMILHLKDVVHEVCIVVLFIISNGCNSSQFGLEVLMFHLHDIVIYLS